VSHDLASVEATCDKAVWLADAIPQATGRPGQLSPKYRAAVEQNAALTTSAEGVVEVLKVEIEAPTASAARSEQDLSVRLELRSPKPLEANFFLGVSQGSAFPMFIVRYSGSFPAGDFEVKCQTAQPSGVEGPLLPLARRCPATREERAVHCSRGGR